MQIQHGWREDQAAATNDAVEKTGCKTRNRGQQEEGSVDICQSVLLFRNGLDLAVDETTAHFF